MLPNTIQITTAFRRGFFSHTFHNEMFNLAVQVSYSWPCTPSLYPFLSRNHSYQANYSTLLKLFLQYCLTSLKPESPRPRDCSIVIHPSDCSIVTNPQVSLLIPYSMQEIH